MYNFKSKSTSNNRKRRIKEAYKNNKTIKVVVKEEIKGD